MTDKINNTNAQNVLLERIKVLQEKNKARNEAIIKKAGSELISNSPESFAFSFTTLVLAGAGVFAASPILASGAAFGLIASVSLLGIQIAGLMAPVKQSEYEQIQQVTSGMFGLVFSVVGQMTGGNKGFIKFGNIGSSVDNLLEMRNLLTGIYTSKGIIDAAPKLYTYGTTLESFIDSMSILARNELLTTIHSTNKPMTTTNIETDPDNVRTQQQRALDDILNSILEIEKQEKIHRDSNFEKEMKDAKDEKEAKDIKARKDAADAKALQKAKEERARAAAASAAFWDAYFKMTKEVHQFEQRDSQKPESGYKPPPSSSESNKNNDNSKGGSYFKMPDIPHNEYIPPPVNNSSQGSGSNLNHGGSSTGVYSGDSSGESSNLGGPLG